MRRTNPAGVAKSKLFPCFRMAPFYRAKTAPSNDALAYLCQIAQIANFN